MQSYLLRRWSFTKFPENQYLAPIENEKMDQDFKSDFNDEGLNAIFGMLWHKRETVDKTVSGTFIIIVHFITGYQ
ncbi:hypothetical protein [Serratia marcescens]|uniref:hypothetical protein n=1 Tax=Serratia TaxID=613 RepID=UPI001FAF13ED|nr:hypothetical protein [Serratia marcescens]